MKKAIAILAAVACVAAVAGCAKKADTSFKVGLVTDVGGIDDKSFNQSTWEGVVRFGEENKLAKDKQYKYLQSSAEADYIPNLSTFAEEKLNLVIAPGFLFSDAIKEVSGKYPSVNFLAIDTVIADRPNVASAIFAEQEGSFLVGVAVALKAKADGKKIVGYMGGMQFPSIERWQAGYEQGIKAVYPECKVLVDYAGAFDKPDVGQTLAQKQYNAGAYIVFPVAGATGNGVIKEAKERNAKGQVVWACGVDKDQYADGFYGDNTKSAILTSMVKRVDLASHDTALLAKQGTFPGGQTLVFSLKNNGVTLPAVNPNLSADITKAVDEFAAKIKSGEIVVSEIPEGKSAK